MRHGMTLEDAITFIRGGLVPDSGYHVVREAEYGGVLVKWHEASDGSDLSQLTRCKYMQLSDASIDL